MNKHRDQVIVVRGWLEGDQVWVRVLATDGVRRQWVVVGSERACELIAALLDGLADPQAGADDPLTY